MSFKGTPPVNYINASPIRFEDIKEEFIASIAPKPVSFENFWQMIIERRVSVIVMLTDLQEGGKRKSDQYWPDRDNIEMEIGSGISLKYESSSYQGVFITRQVNIILAVIFNLFTAFTNHNLNDRTIKVTKDSREISHVTHLQTKKWADLTAPEDTKIMLDMVGAIRTISRAQASPEPILVHCSAGVGRTGTFIGVYKLIEDFYDEK